MSSGAPLRVLHQQAQQAIRARNYPQALTLLQQAVDKTSARESEYRPVLDDLREVYTQLGKARHALTVDWYRAEGRAEAALLEHVPLADRARTLQAWAERSEEPKRFAQAAEAYERAEMVAHAAICREKAGDDAAARTLWSRLAETLVREGADPYAAGLARFNLARCAVKTNDERAARTATVAAVHLLEEAADRYERIGQRERAFDCFQVLIAIGKQSGEFEHVLEGYVNVVRILRQDNLRYYALQNYEDALDEAEERSEFSAGATLAAEMGAYAQNEGMASLANYATEQQARMWRFVAQAVVQRGGPVEMAENALLAAIVALARQGQFASVGELYRLLGEADLEPVRKAHYTRAAKRYDGVQNAAVEAGPLPKHLRQDGSFPDVWHVDLVEWEQRGSAAMACGDVILAPDWSEVTRRRAMRARLQALDVDAADGEATLGMIVSMTQSLGQVELYTILSPLEHLYRDRRPEVRLAVVDALQKFMYKRTFVTVRAALDDPDQAVKQHAYEAVKLLRFPHAFDPLARIFRDSDDRTAREAAVDAIARIDTSEAAELLLGVFQHEGKAERAAAAQGLKNARGGQFLDVARRAFPSLAQDAQQQVREVFRHRGENI